MSRPRKTIWITLQFEGIHKYPAALENPALKDVDFLGYPHRHQFHVKAELEVFHDDRDLEFILVKRDLQKSILSGILQLDHKSCEMISDDIANYLKAKYPKRWICIDVSEDGENGCHCEYPVQKFFGDGGAM
jgi:hypothetical protein